MQASVGICILYTWILIRFLCLCTYSLYNAFILNCPSMYLSVFMDLLKGSTRCQSKLFEKNKAICSVAVLHIQYFKLLTGLDHHSSVCACACACVCVFHRKTILWYYVPHVILLSCCHHNVMIMYCSLVWSTFCLQQQRAALSWWAPAWRLNTLANGNTLRSGILSRDRK